MKLKTIIGILLLIAGRTAFSQGFVNLNFESAQIIPLTQGAFEPGSSIATTNALPGWTVFCGSSQQSQITYNDPALGSTFVTLWATNGTQTSGNFTVMLQGGLTASAASISQTGLVPNSTESLLFEAQPGVFEAQSATGILQVFLGGQSLPVFALSSGANFTLYGADISAFAGQTDQLMFSALQNFQGPNNWNIDNIQFSPTAVPEPSALGFSALGSFFLAWRRWKNR